MEVICSSRIALAVSKLHGIIFQKITKCVELGNTLEATHCTATQEIPSISWNPKVNYGLKFGVFVIVTMKNAIFWDVIPCDSCKNRRVGGTCRLHHQGEKN
jgi:hypothetical protein